MIHRDPRWTVAPLHPFGLLITARDIGTDVERVPAELLRSLVRRHNVVVLREFQTFGSTRSFEDYGHRLGAPLSGRFGTVTQRVERRNGGMPVATVTRPTLFRWDGMFLSRIPELQVSHCVTAPGGADGGRSVFVDTTRVLGTSDPGLVSALAKIVITYRSAGDDAYCGIARSPLIVPHPIQRFPVIRFAECGDDDESTVRHVQRRMVGSDAAGIDRVLDALRSRLAEPALQYRHQWRTGDILIANNYAVLHRRELFPCAPARRVQQLWVLGNPPCPNPSVL